MSTTRCQSGCETTLRTWTGFLHYSPAPRLFALHVIGALTGAGGEAVVQGVAQGAHWVRPRPAGEAGGGRRLVRLAAVLRALPGVGVAFASAAA